MSFTIKWFEKIQFDSIKYIHSIKCMVTRMKFTLCSLWFNSINNKLFNVQGLERWEVVEFCHFVNLKKCICILGSEYLKYLGFLTLLFQLTRRSKVWSSTSFNHCLVCESFLFHEDFFWPPGCRFMTLISKLTWLP